MSGLVLPAAESEVVAGSVWMFGSVLLSCHAALYSWQLFPLLGLSWLVLNGTKKPSHKMQQSGYTIVVMNEMCFLGYYDDRIALDRQQGVKASLEQ